MSTKIELAELLRIFPGVDESLAAELLSATGGCRQDCIEQLAMISGMQPQQRSDSMGGREDSSPGSVGEPIVAMGNIDEAIATGKEKEELERKTQLAGLMKEKVEDVYQLMLRDKAFDAAARQQQKLGPQSCRGTAIAKGLNFNKYSSNKHHQECFRLMIEREAEHCGEFVVFYHSYSFAALMYEVQSCIARVVYGLPDEFSAFARLLKKPFANKPHLSVLLEKFKSMQGQDHDPGFREVAISTSVSLLAPSSEAPPISCFQQGYSCNDLSFHGVLKKLFESLGLDSSTAVSLCESVANLGEKKSGYDRLNGHLFRKAGGTASRCENDAGHMLQIFVRVDCVDDIAYGCHAMGVYDPAPGKNPLSVHLTREKSPDGQARVFWHPTLFIDPTKVRLYHYAADEKFHKNRVAFQKELQQVLFPLLGTPQSLLRTLYAIEGGEVGMLKKRKK